MTNKMLTALTAVVCATLLAIPAVSAEKSAPATQKTTAKTTTTVPQAWPAESLSGTIAMVDPARRIVTIKDSSGVPFDMVVNRSTRIKLGQREVKLQDLTSDVNKPASVKFIPERRGDIARSIQMNG